MGSVGSGAGGDQRHEESTAERPIERRNRGFVAGPSAAAVSWMRKGLWGGTRAAPPRDEDSRFGRQNAIYKYVTVITKRGI
jgi:hypothetical protein